LGKFIREGGKRWGLGQKGERLGTFWNIRGGRKTQMIERKKKPRTQHKKRHGEK